MCPDGLESFIYQNGLVPGSNEEIIDKTTPRPLDFSQAEELMKYMEFALMGSLPIATPKLTQGATYILPRGFMEEML